MQVRTAEYRFPSADGKTQVYAKQWIPDTGYVRFIVQIVHGMADFIERYDGFARYLCRNGAVVVGHDQLGHGHTGEEQGILGHFADKGGYEVLIQDMYTLNRTARENFPGLPLVMFGHSMGSLLARRYIAEYGGTVDAAILSGTSGENNLTKLAKLIAEVGILFGRSRKPGNLLTRLAFGHYNDRVENPRTPNDWLTRDEQVVREYNENPLNTFRLTNRAQLDFAKLLEDVTGLEWSRQLPRDIGYLLISGAMDPVGAYGEGVREVEQWMREAGIPDTTMLIYNEARHELTNELNRMEIYDDIRQWIAQHLELGDL